MSSHGALVIPARWCLDAERLCSEAPVPCVLGGIPPVAWPVMADWQDQSPKPICPERPPTGGLQGRELGSHCAGTGSTGCLLWEGRAQQLGQSLVFGPPELRVSYGKAVLSAQRVGTHPCGRDRVPGSRPDTGAGS